MNCSKLYQLNYNQLSKDYNYKRKNKTSIQQDILKNKINLIYKCKYFRKPKNYFKNNLLHKRCNNLQDLKFCYKLFQLTNIQQNKLYNLKLMNKPNKKQGILLKLIKKYIFTNANILRNQEIILCAIHHTYRLIIYWSCLVTTNSSR